MVTTHITRLEDARALKTMGMPLNMPVEKKFFSEEYSRHWIKLHNAHGRFMGALAEHVDGPRAGSLGKWRLLERRFTNLRKEMFRCDVFIGDLLGGESMSKVRLGTASEQDQHEGQLLAWFITERAMPFVEFWQRAFMAAQSGAGVSIKPGDIPKWMDDE